MGGAWKKAEVSSLTGPEKYAGRCYSISVLLSTATERSCSFAVATVVGAVGFAEPRS